MDKDFEKKVKQKRIRTIAVAVVILAAVIYLITGTKVEKADYTDSLKKEIKAAQELYAANKDHTGNGSGQYAAYTILKFEKDIAKAEAVAADENSEYHAKKTAYETLKAQADTFKKDQNALVLNEDDVAALMEGNERKTVETELENQQKIVYTIDGSTLKTAADMNLMARAEGPYYAEINEILAGKKLQGQVVSFYQEGSFGGKIKVLTPFYSEEETKGYAYKIDPEKGKLTFVSNADIDMEAQTVAFSVKEGGDYVVLTKKLHKDKKTVAVKSDTEEDNHDSQTESDEGTVETPDQDVQNDGENEQQAAAPESDGIAVSLYIRCDTLAADLSKLRDPSLESYVPADGVILALNEVNVTKGESVYDVLDRVCRDKGIHLEAVYTPNYGADYIEGINYLYEFDAGEQSGWMYTVNGVFPNYGCSDYILEDGDSIVWAYTCDMGKDLGK